MNKLKTFLSIVALSTFGIAWAGPIPETQDSASGFSSFDLPAEQTGTFEMSFNATPLADKIDAFTGISATTPRSANDVSAIVRFNDSGKIDVRNGNAFRADQSLAYSANKVYRMRMVVDVARKTYSVFVTAPGQPEVSLAKDYAFRTSGAVPSLGKIVLAGFAGRDGYFTAPHRVSGVSIKAM
jgi:hypothetical protein